MNTGLPTWLSKFGKKISGYPLRKKLWLIFGVSGAGILVLTIFLIALFDWAFARSSIQTQYQGLGEVLALDVAPILELDGTRKDALDTLEAFGRIDGLLYSAVLLGEGEVYASFGDIPDGTTHDLLPQNYVRLRYMKGRIEAMQPIRIVGTEEERIEGYIFLVGDLGPLYRSFLIKSGLFVILLGIGGVFVMWIASRLSQLITAPILELTRTAERISKDRDFSHRQTKVFDDETGVLVDAFNEMMRQIEERGAIIRSNEERFREYFELGVAGMAILDSEGRFIEANEQLSEMLETSSEWLLSSRFDDWAASSPGQADESRFEILRDKCSPGYRDERWLRGSKDDRIFAIVSMRRLAKALDEDDFLYLVLIQDISDRKRVEEELLSAKQVAEEANRSKDEFLSVMSHELRTPLNPIIGFVDLLMCTDQCEEQLGMLRSIRRSSEHLLTLITDILEFTRAQGGRLEASPEAFDLPDLCRNAIEITERSGISNGVVVEFRSLGLECVPSGVRLYSDAGKIRQVVINFLSNAIKYNKDGGRVWLDAKVVDLGDENLEICIDVEDTGIGISEEKKDFVFEPFTQLDMSLQRKHEGVGLGLSICKRIAECLGGGITVASQVGVGSVFSLRVPVAFVHDDRIGEPQRTELKALPFEYGLSRVLLVEDDQENMKLVEAKLRQLGVEFEWAKNGLDATEKVSSSHFDLVLMDVRMPLMDGLEATRVIRESEVGKRNRIPIVAMTAHASERMRIECTSVGMDGYMSKPIQFEQLEGCLKRYLAG